MRRLPFLLACLSLGVLARPGLAEREQVVEGSRIHLGELFPNLEATPAELDLGPSPKAGNSRLFARDELNRLLREAGQQHSVDDSVRVVRATKRWTQHELVDWLSPAIKNVLPSHATLVEFDAPRVHLAPTTAVIGNVEVAKLPRRRGTVRTTAVVELTVDGKLEQRLSLPVVLEVGEPPKPATVNRGQTITVSIALGQARVSTAAISMQSAEVGAIVLCRVIRTKKVVRARLLSPETAEVVLE